MSLTCSCADPQKSEQFPAPHCPHRDMQVLENPRGVLAMGQPKTREGASAERVRASVISLVRLIFFFLSFLAGSKSWSCCQTSGAGLHPKRRLCARTSHGEWVHNEEPFTEATNNETTADAGTMPSASVDCCAVHLTGNDRANWNGEVTSQQKLRSDPGISGLSQTKAVVSLGCHVQERPRPSAAQQVQVQMCPLLRKGRNHSPLYHCCHSWSATELGGKMQRVSQPQERCSPCLSFSLVPWGLTGGDAGLQFVLDLAGL